MLNRRIFGVMILALLSLYGMIHAQEPPDKLVQVVYNGIEFSYAPEAFGAVLPVYDEGTPYQTDAPYFANIAPHTSFKFMRPDPAYPDINWVGELRVYRIADLEAYAEPTYREVVDQLRTLDTATLAAHVNAGPDARLPGLPFMPVLNATQVFWAHPKVLISGTAAGVEYCTYYSVAPEPIVEGQVMYAYQAISVDGLYYLSFSMPLETGLLDSAIPDQLNVDEFVADYVSYLQKTFDAINTADPATFKPLPDELTRFIKSISIVEKPD